jgi:hypothetical protein
VPNSTAVEQFQTMVLRAFDALATENRARDERTRQIEIIVARDAGARDASAVAPTRIVALELAAIAPERMRELEAKVTRLDVRSGIIGAAAGLLGAAAAGTLLHFLFPHVAG